MAIDSSSALVVTRGRYQAQRPARTAGPLVVLAPGTPGWGGSVTVIATFSTVVPVVASLVIRADQRVVACRVADGVVRDEHDSAGAA